VKILLDIDILFYFLFDFFSCSGKKTATAIAKQLECKKKEANSVLYGLEKQHLVKQEKPEKNSKHGSKPLWSLAGKAADVSDELAASGSGELAAGGSGKIAAGGSGQLDAGMFRDTSSDYSAPGAYGSDADRVCIDSCYISCCLFFCNVLQQQYCAAHSLTLAV
jgi:hypothetical protein